MIKRVLPVFLSVVVLVSVLAFPVSAAEFENDTMFDVLAYSFPNNSTSYEVSINSGDIVHFDAPSAMYLYVDMLVRCSAKELSVSCNGSALHVERVEYLSGYIFRIYGNMATYDLDFKFEHNGTNNLFTFESLHVSTQFLTPNNLNASMEIHGESSSYNITYLPGGSNNSITIPANASSYDKSSFVSYIEIPNWIQYDFIDIQLFFKVGSITSVSAVFGSQNLPLDLSFLGPDNVSGHEYFVSLRIDLSGINRSVDDYPMVILNGRFDPSVINSISFMNCSGMLKYENPNALQSQLMRIYYSIKSGFDGMMQGLSDFQSHWTKYMSDWMISLNNNIGNFDNHFISYTKKVKEWIDDQTNKMVGWFETINNNIALDFVDLDNWIKSQTDSLIAAIKGDSSAADAFNDGVGQKKDEVNEMLDVMGSVNKPDLGSFDLSGAGVIDQNIMATSMSGLSSVIKHPIFLPIITLSLTLATAAYVLFGKR